MSANRHDDAETAELRAALVDDLEALAAHLLGEPNHELSGKAEWRWGSKGARSLQIRSTGGKRRGDWFDHSANEGGGPLHMIRDARGQGWADAFAFARNWAGLDGTKPQDRPKPRQPDPAKIAAQAVEAAADRARKVRTAADFWRQRRPIEGTPAVPYLAGRALHMPAGVCPGSIAFLPGQHHALIVAGTDDAGTVQAVQVVHLDAAGRKVKDRPADWPEHWRWATKQTFGAPQGAPVRLPSAAPGGPLLLAEGPETGLSVWIATGCETWVALGSFSNITPPAGRPIVVCRDDDKRFSPADRKLAKTIAAWREAGLKAVVALPFATRRENGGDFNDLLQEAGPDAVRAAIEAAHSPADPGGRRRLPRDEARRVLDGAVSRFFNAAANYNPEAGPPPVHAVKVDVGGGKSLAARKAAAAFIARRRAAGDGKAVVVFATPTHKLADEQAIAFEALPAARAAGLVAGIWRGRSAPDPDAPGELMCRNLDAVHDAQAAGANVQRAVCKGKAPDGSETECPFFQACGYQRQRQRKADAWFVAHEMMFQEKPAAIGDVAAIVPDEGMWATGLEGASGRPVTLALDSLASDHTVSGSADATERLRFLRDRIGDVLRAQPDGHLHRDVIEAEGFTALSAQEARVLEWRRHVDPAMHPGMTQADRKAAVKAAEGNRTVRRLVAFWRAVEGLLSDGGPEASGWVELATERDDKGAVRVLRLKGRKEVRDGWKAPTLVIDATLSVDLVRPFWPQVELTADVTIEAPHQHIAQVVDVSFSKRRLLAWDGAPEDRKRSAAKNLRNLHATICGFARGHAPRPVLVVAQKAVEEALPGCGPLPPNVILGHHNAVAGRDEWTTTTGETIKGADLSGLLVVGRTLPGPGDVERLAEALTGAAVPPLPGWYDRVKVAREMVEGQAIEGEAERHPDPTAEAIRWQICEGELVQILGRGRGVNRDADNPLSVLILTDIPLPVPVNQMLTLADLAPSPRDLMLAAGGIAYDNPTDAAAAYPALWATRERAKDAFKYAAKAGGWGESRIDNLLIPDSPQPLAEGSTGLSRIDYQPAGMGKRRVAAWFDPATVPNPVAALVAAVGPLAWCQVEPAPKPIEPPDEAVAPPVQAVPDQVKTDFAPAPPHEPLAGLWTIRGSDWRVTIAADSAATVALWVPTTGENADIPENIVLPMLAAPMPAEKPHQRIEPDPDLPPLPEPFAGWMVEPRKPNVLSRMMT